MEKNLHISALLDVYGAFLGEKQRKLTSYYYNDDLSLSAENEGITRQGVNDQIKRAVKSLNAFEEKCRYCEHFEQLRALASDLKAGDKKAAEKAAEIIEKL